jgi:Pyruvate/2-oxoacid:ferredoxin oxidoreductase delta subunit
MKNIRTLGLSLFIIALGLFTVSITFSTHELSDAVLQKIEKKHHRQMLKEQASNLLDKTYSNNITFIQDLKPALKSAQAALDKAAGVDRAKGIWNATTLPEGVAEWDYRMGDYEIKNYLFTLTKYSAGGLVPGNASLFFFLTFILGSLGALIYMFPMLQTLPGIKHDGIYFNAVQRGVQPKLQALAVIGVLLSALLVMILSGGFLWLVFTLLVTGALYFLIKKADKLTHQKTWALPFSSTKNAWIGILLGTYLIVFYVLLYFFPYYLTNWVLLVEPIKKAISGGAEASQWFLYGLLYCFAMLVMGVRMLIKYRHNRYQLFRTASVLFFQVSFAFLIPEMLARFNNPAVDLKTAWPLDYSFFYDYRMDGMLVQNSNVFLGMNVGTIMFVWGLLLSFILVPLFTYLYGKRWYCSWVCGCGGLAETLGDPFRQQSDKSLRAWRVERYVIHGVMVLAFVMTLMVLYTYITGASNILIFDSNDVRTWYGFMVGAMFAGVVGTGFYPLMGNRAWCRFGCPLAAAIGLVQRFKSRFRITTNGGQCISCGNCSTYCEMGIDVRAYAQRGQDIVRSSCVGCGVCSAVCPRGVLRLENSSEDIKERGTETRTVHVPIEDVTFL